MARLTRLAVAGQAHLVLLRGHGGQPVFGDDLDRAAFVSALEAACDQEKVALHAFALLPSQVWLLATPAQAQGVGRAIQVLGRRFSAGVNRRYRRSGSVWDGRYRSAIVEPGAELLKAMVFVEQAPVRSGMSLDAVSAEWSSARQHSGLKSEYSLTDCEAYWLLGNTPFDRCAAYRTLLDEPQPRAYAEKLAGAVMRGWPIGSQAFVEGLRQYTSRPLVPRPRGRPRKPSVAI